ncbi:MAG: formate dehydrogenase accessory sulfurtransferase FdhD [Thermoanaerobaculia bacterium]
MNERRASRPPSKETREPGATVRIGRVRMTEAGAEEDVDLLAVEAPLEIRIGGEPFTVLMRTPGNDEELVTGFLVSEGLVHSAASIRALGRPALFDGDDCDNFLEVELERSSNQPPERRFFASASCGVCGKSSIADLEIRAEPVSSTLVVPAGLVEALPERLRAAQPAFAETGGLHRSGALRRRGRLLARARTSGATMRSTS